MKKIIYTALCLMGVGILYSCKEDEKIPGNPVMDIQTEQVSAFFGDSLPFTVNVSDQDVPLSTLKAQLFFGEEKVSETVIRTKESGKDYSGKIYVPFFKNIPDGKATLKYILQNIHFTLTEKEVELSCSRPQFDHLVLVTSEGEEYQMDKTGENQYAVTAEFPQRLEAYIKAPAYGQNGNELFFGYSTESTITEGTKSTIPFSALQAGEYTVSFNTMTYEGAPFVSMKLNGEEFTTIDGNTMEITVDLTQGQELVFDGVPDYDNWYIDSDYFVKDESGKLTFKPLGGTYKIKALLDKMCFTVVRMNGDSMAVLDNDGHGALWILGWGLGHPSLGQQFGWSWDNDYNGYCVAEVSPKVYQFSGYAGPEQGSVNGQRIRFDYLDFKFYKNRAWDTEFKQSEMTLEGGLLKLAEPNALGFSNINMADGVQLEEGAFYVFTVDLTNGNDKPVIRLEKK